MEHPSHCSCTGRCHHRQQGRCCKTLSGHSINPADTEAQEQDSNSTIKVKTCLRGTLAVAKLVATVS